MDWIAASGLAVAALALVIQWRTHSNALQAQTSESREGRRHAEALAREDREHHLALAREDRLWARRADLYAQLLEAVRSHIESQSLAESMPLEDNPAFTSLVAQADVLASREVRDCFSEFVYGGLDRDEKINIWSDVQIAIKRDLGVPRD